MLLAYFLLFIRLTKLINEIRKEVEVSRNRCKSR